MLPDEFAARGDSLDAESRRHFSTAEIFFGIILNFFRAFTTPKRERHVRPLSTAMRNFNL
jgi:hypothetical protein